MATLTSERARIVISLGVVYVVWGSTYLAIRVMVRSIPPLLGAGARFLAAGVVLAMWVAIHDGPAVFRMSLRQLANASGIGLFVLVGGIGLLTVAERDVPSGLAVLLVASIPLWVIVLRVAHREKVSLPTIGSVLIGFGGVGLLLLPGSRCEAAGWSTTLLVVVAAVSTAVGAFYAGRSDTPDNALVAAVIEMTFAGIALVGVGSLMGEWRGISPHTMSSSSKIAFAYLVIFGSLIAYTAFIWVLDHAPVSLVATYAYVNPVVALILGVVFLDEDVSTAMAGGAAAVVLSVVVAVRAEHHAQREISA